MMNKTIRLVALSVATVVAGLAATTACTDYQDEIDALDYRVTVLEQLTTSTNTNLQALQTIVEAMDQGDYITNVTQTSQGYIVTFAKHGAVTVLNGAKGSDATVPAISVAQDADGNYYWTLDGAWLLDSNGNKVRANGLDGHDGLTPQVKVSDDGYWMYSTDGGITWTTTTQKVTGSDGMNAEQVIKEVKDNGDGTVSIVLGTGTVYVIPLNEALPVYVTSIALADSRQTITLARGETRELVYSVLPENATFKAVYCYVRKWLNVPIGTDGSREPLEITTSDGHVYVKANEKCEALLYIIPRFAQSDDLHDEITITVP